MNAEQVTNHNYYVSTLMWQIATLLQKFTKTGDFFYYARAAVYKQRLFKVVDK